ncbi:unnamed protein product, partial [marine sediment metagenome]
ECPPSGQYGCGQRIFPKEVQNEIKALAVSIKTLANNINAIIGDRDNKASIKQTLVNVTAMTDQATRTLKSIEGLSDVGAEAIGNTAEQLDSTLAELQKVLAKVNSGEGTAARLLNDGQLYENLLDTVKELKAASEQLRVITTDIKEGRRKIITLW